MHTSVESVIKAFNVQKVHAFLMVIEVLPNRRSAITLMRCPKRHKYSNITEK